MSTVTLGENGRPETVTPIFEAIPDALTVQPCWVVWRWECRDGKWTKPPFNARTGAPAKSTDSETWSTFEEAVCAYERGGWDGVGFAVSPPIIGVDLDDVVDPETGRIGREASKLVRELDSYTEGSPSGRGLRIIAKGALSPGWRNTRKWHFPIEMYDGGRYLTVTGHHVEGTPTTIEERTVELDALHTRVATVIGPSVTTTGNGSRPPDAAPVNVDDDELLDRARRAQNGAEFSQLFDQGVGDTEDHSAADLALCARLAFWTGRDAARIDRLFRRSALMRSKWDERHFSDGRTYGQATIEKAIASCTEVYGGRGPAVVTPSHSAAPVEVDPVEEVPTLEPPPFEIVTSHDSFVTAYVAYASMRTDAPPEAHELAAIGILSALAGPRPRLPIATSAGGWPLTVSTLYVVNSTVGRKTTVLDIARDVLVEVLGLSAILEWEGSPQGFIQRIQLRNGQAAVLLRDEYSGLLSQINRGGHMAGMEQTLIRAYDGKVLENIRTRKRDPKTGQFTADTDRVDHPYLVTLAASTRDTFLTRATEDNVLSGLLARFVFVTGRATTPRAPGLETPTITAAMQDVLTRARAFHDRAQETLRVTPASEVIAAYWEVEQAWVAAGAAAPRSDAARATMQRLAETVLKVAALLALDGAAPAGDVCIQPEHFEAARRMGERWMPQTLSLIEQLGRSEFRRLCDSVLATIVRPGATGISLGKLYRHHRDIKGKVMEEILSALETQELIVRTKGDTPRGRRALRFYGKAFSPNEDSLAEKPPEP